MCLLCVCHDCFAHFTGVDTIVCLQVIIALSASCFFLLVRSCFGLLAVEHAQFSQESRLLYSCVVLPELIALYIVAVPGLISGVGEDLADNAGVVPIGTSNSHIPMASGSPTWGISGGDGEDQGRDAALLAGRGDLSGDAVLPLGSGAYGSMTDKMSAERVHAYHAYGSQNDGSAPEDSPHARWQSMPNVTQVQPSQS